VGLDGLVMLRTGASRMEDLLRALVA